MSGLIRPLRQLGRHFARNWYTKLTQLFIALMLINTITIFEGYWWEETYAIAVATLLLAVAVDTLIPIRSRALRLALQLMLAFAVTIYSAGIQRLPWSPEGAREWAAWLQEYAVQLDPFIWISLALLAIYTLFSLWIKNRSHLFGFIGTNLIVLTIADSFTPVWLWDEVAWIVFLGLLWLVAAHLHKLEREHPGSWRELVDYPLQLLLPVSIVMTLVMTAGLLMPSVKPLLQDPYTVWRESKGETVDVFLGDKGASNLSSSSQGDTSSGYGRDDSALGGGFNYDYSPVMTITTSHRSYWRGETKNIYSGQGWSAAETNMEQELISGIQKDTALPMKDDRNLAEVSQVEQTVRMIRKDKYSVLFAAAPISQINWINNPELPLPRGIMWQPSAMELRWVDWSMSNFPEAYSVTSEVTVLDEEGLRSTNAGWKDTTRTQEYTLLPPDLPARVRDLAEEITAAGENDYDKAKLIEAYLRLNFTYTNKPDMSKLSGASNDFVDQFLFELQEGYCDYFSTAMAVMSRSIGLPARWVKGFAPGALPVSGPSMGGPLDEEMINPDGQGTYTVRNSDAHSWVEIYFEGYGWIPFEATAGFSFPYTVAEAEQAPLPSTIPDADNTEVKAVVKSSTSMKAGLWSALSLFVVAAAALLIVRRKVLVASWKKFRFRSYTPDERIVWETERLLRKCRRRGLERAEHETLREAIFRWSKSRKRMQGEFREVLDGFEKAKYSPVSATDDEAEHFILKVKAITEQL